MVLRCVTPLYRKSILSGRPQPSNTFPAGCISGWQTLYPDETTGPPPEQRIHVLYIE